MEANKAHHEDDAITLKDLILNIRKSIAYLCSRWKIIAALMITGGIAGFFYAKTKTTLYQAESIFVLDEGKSDGNALGGLAILGVGTNNTSAGLFTSTKNIVWLYKSRPMLYQTLMTPVSYNKRKKLLIDIFLDESGIRKKLEKVPGLKNIRFNEKLPLDSLNTEQSGLVLSCIGMLKSTKYLNITETSKAENLITVTFKSKDEQFSKLFTETLVNNVNQYYIKTKTEKTNEEVIVLERKVDSARMMLNANMYQAAASVEDVPYANPVKATLQVAPERKRIDVGAISATYLELSKSLETRRMALAQETPLIQLLEGPVYPLNVIKPSSVTYGTVGALLAALLTVVVLIVIRWYKNILNT